MDDKYFHHNSKTTLPIPLQISKELKTFCRIFIAFSASTLNFKHFEKKKKNELNSLRISEIIDSERRDYLNAQRILFLKTLLPLRVDESQKLLITAKKHFYPKFSSL